MAKNSPQKPARPGKPRLAARPTITANPSPGQVSRSAGRATARSTLPQRSFSDPTTKKSKALITP